MLSTLDPVSFLGVDQSQLSSEQEIADLREELKKQMTGFVMLKLSQDLTPEQQDSLIAQNNPDELMAFLQSNVPNLDQRVDSILEEFKQEYQKTN